MSHTNEIIETVDQLESEEELEVSLHEHDRPHLCQHEFHDGALCQMVAPANEEFCRWHSTAADRLLRRYKYEKRRSKQAIKGLVIPTIEDSYSLQVAVHELMDAIIEGRVDHQRAGQLLYALQISQNNIRGHFHFPRMRFSEANLEDILRDQLKEEREAERQRAATRKKPPQSLPAEAVGL